MYSMLCALSVLTHYLSVHRQVSVLSYGAWVTFGTQLDVSQVRPLCLSRYSLVSMNMELNLVCFAGQGASETML